jgi:hypothetical protein
MNIQYAWDTFPAAIKEPLEFTDLRSYGEILRTEVIPKVRNMDLNLPFPNMWMEWKRLGPITDEDGTPTMGWVDCAVLLAEEGDELFIATTWEDARREVVARTYPIPMFTTTKIPRDIFHSEGDIGDITLTTRVTAAGEYLAERVLGRTEEEEKVRIAESTNELLWGVIWTLLLLSCNNISLVETKPFHRSTKRQKDPTRVIYHELAVQVPPGGKRTRSESMLDEQAGTAFHVRRGHFADYTKGKGLFGKYHGKYWIPATTVGDIDYGTVIKSYKLEGAQE